MNSVLRLSPDQRAELFNAVAHKQVFFPAAWSRYDLAVPGSFVLIPPPERLEQIAIDYREMQVMYFGRPKPWDELVARLTALQATINQPRR